MKTLSLRVNIKDGRLLIDLPTDLPSGPIDVELHLPDDSKPTGEDIVAWLKTQPPLEWKGDALELQRRLRDEWPD